MGRIPQLPKRREVSILIEKEDSIHWNGQTLPSLTHGARQKRLLTQSSSGPQLSGKAAHSGPVSTFLCVGASPHGGGKYTKKNPKQKHKIESKKIGCPCHVLIKIYPHTTTILGHYKKAHNHETGATNIKYMGISRDARECVKALLGERVDWQQVVCKLYLVLS
jgi:hypothetical protein